MASPSSATGDAPVDLTSPSFALDNALTYSSSIPTSSTLSLFPIPTDAKASPTPDIHSFNAGSAQTNSDVEEEIISSDAAALLQACQAEPCPVTQVPVAFLQPLMDTVGELQRTVALLQTNAASAAIDMAMLRRQLLVSHINSGVQFALFSKLPEMVRKMIWVYSINLPRVIGLRAVYVNEGFEVVQAGRNYPQLHVYKESRNIALRILEPLAFSFIFEKRPMLLSYYNPHASVLWIVEKCITAFSCQVLRDSLGKAEFQTLAFTWSAHFLCMDDQDEFKCQLFWLGVFRVEEYIIILGHESCLRLGNVTLVPPTGTPASFIREYKKILRTRGEENVKFNYKKWHRHGTKRTKPFKDLTWKDLTEQVTEDFQAAYDSVASQRNRALLMV